MCEPKESSQLKDWLYTPEALELCRARANRLARKMLATSDGAPSSAASIASEENSSAKSNTNSAVSLVESFARDFNKQKDSYANEEDGPWQTESGNPFLDPSEEHLLVSFYCSKLPELIGPMARVPRLRRESKVPATAALLFRRFYLSNSVMVHDPKTIMVAAAFLAAKVEDAMTDVRYLEEGTKLMDSPVSSVEIIPAEVKLLTGIHFDLLCFHPYKAVLSITEDMRTYLKSEKGKTLVYFPGGNDRPIVGQDLKPTHDAAQLIVNDVIISDIPLLYTPGQVGVAALMVANEQQLQQGKDQQLEDVPQIDILGYLSQRFVDEADVDGMGELLQKLCGMLRELKDQGKYGCVNHNTDMAALKSIHKKLKKVRMWGEKKDKDKKKKRKKGGGDDDGNSNKKAKTQ